MAKSYPGFPEGAFTSEDPLFIRLKAQNLTINQQQIIDGVGCEWWWRTREAAIGARLFARFTVPDGYYMALDNRIFQTSKEVAFYRVYAENQISGAVTVGADLPIKSNLRNDSNLILPQVANAVTLLTPPDRDLAFIEIAEFSTQGQANTNAGELNSDSTFRLLRPGSIFYLEKENAATTTAYLKLTLLFALIPANNVTGFGESLTPIITEQPQDQSVVVGATPLFSVAAAVDQGALEFQWQADTGAGFVDMPTETSATLTLPPVGLVNNGNLFRARVTANGRSAVSRAASLTVTI